jgi:hypothetical protein
LIVINLKSSSGSMMPSNPKNAPSAGRTVISVIGAPPTPSEPTREPAPVARSIRMSTWSSLESSPTPYSTPSANASEPTRPNPIGPTSVASPVVGEMLYRVDAAVGPVIVDP